MPTVHGLLAPRLVAAILTAMLAQWPLVSLAAGPWAADYETAVKQAEETNKPLLLHFHATWCGPCKQMDRNVFSNRELMDGLQSKFVMVKIDTDQRPDVTSRYSIRSMPADVVIDPTNHRVLASWDGFTAAQQYKANCLRAAQKFAPNPDVAKTNKPAGPNEPKPNSIAATPKGTAPSATSPTVQLGDPQPLVGLDGFSPVALAENRTWQRGQSQFSWDYKGVMYYMTSAEELQKFKASPEAYSPRLLGCDPVVLWEKDKALAGGIEHAAFYDDQLYLFSSKESRARFKSNPSKYTRTQHVLRADEIIRTAQR